jgi:apolipoprotein N-acyltransferase
VQPQVLWIIAAGLGALIGHANPWLQLPPAVLLLPASLAALGFAAPSPKAAFKRAWLAGCLASLACLYWVFWPVNHFGGVHWALALPVPVLLAMTMAVYHGLFGLLAQVAGRRLAPLAALFCLSTGWLIMEMATGTLLSGFPWLTLAGAFTPWPLLIQPAAYIGSYGLSGVFALMALGLVLAPRSRACAGASLAAALLIAGAGWQRMDAYAETTPGHTVAVVQGNIDQSLKWIPAYQQATVEKYLALSRKVLADARPELIVWPETSMPFYFQDPTPLRAQVLAFQREAGVDVMLGSPAYNKLGPHGYTLFNRAFLLTADGGAPQWYDKEHLVPFGEYTPLSSLLPIDKLFDGVGDFAPGVNTRALKSGGLALGVLLCYEAIFAGQAQTRVEQGANLLVNISNDAWFGLTSAPLQHLHLTALRAVEQNRWVVRGTNTGISAFIDPLGRIHRAGPQFQDLAATGVVHARTETTPFNRFYGALLWLSAALAAAAALLLLLAGRGNVITRGNK